MLWGVMKTVFTMKCLRVEVAITVVNKAIEDIIFNITIGAGL